VSWIVMQEPIEMSGGQIEEIRNVLRLLTYASREDQRASDPASPRTDRDPRVGLTLTVTARTR